MSERVGRGLQRFRLVWPGREQVFATRPCVICNGGGFISYDRWTALIMDGKPAGRINFGHMSKCYACDCSGRIITAIYTRGVSLTPLVEARQ